MIGIVVFNNEPIIGRNYFHAPCRVRTYKYKKSIIHLSSRSSLVHVGKFIRHGKILNNGYNKGYYVFRKNCKETVIYYDTQIGSTYFIEDKKCIMTSPNKWRGTWIEIPIPTHNGLVDTKWLDTMLEDTIWDGDFD